VIGWIDRLAEKTLPISLSFHFLCLTSHPEHKRYYYTNPI